MEIAVSMLRLLVLSALVAVALSETVHFKEEFTGKSFIKKQTSFKFSVCDVTVTV